MRGESANGVMGAADQMTRYCRGCGYDLRASTGRCPECARAFDAENPRSFARTPRTAVYRRWRRRAGWVAGVLGVLLLPVLVVVWLRAGWRAEQTHIATVPGCRVRMEPMYRWLPKWLPARVRFVADRTKVLVFDEKNISVTGRRSTTPGAADSCLGHIGQLTYLRHLHLYANSATDAGLAHLSRLKKLEVLTLQGEDFTDDGLAQLKGLANLRVLVLSNRYVGDAGLKHLRNLPGLKALFLANSDMTDAGLAHLATMAQLEELHLLNAKISDAGLAQLAEMTGLKSLDLSGSRITDAGLVHVARMATLEGLDLRYTRITDAGLEHLKRMRWLKVLHITGAETTVEGVRRLREALAGTKVNASS
ncbi:MAG: leucine-rich repeat domain-containing protein [Bacillota bacterium]